MTPLDIFFVGGWTLAFAVLGVAIAESFRKEE